MKMYSQQILRSIICCCSVGCAISSSAIGDTVYDMGDAGDAASYTYNGRPNSTARFDSITSPQINVRAISSTDPFNIEVGKVTGDDVRLTTSIGNITLGDVEAEYLQVSTKQGDITLTGTINCTGNASNIAISGDSTAGGNIILNGADLSGVSLENYCFDDSYNLVPIGKIEITGNTTLNGVYFKAGTVDVAEGANLTLIDSAFTNRQESIDGTPANTDLVLGDNVTLTLSGAEPLSVKSLTIGEGVDLIISLNADEFVSLEDSVFELFSVEEGGVDLSSVNFTFTDGVQYKSGTVSSNGGSITITNSYTVPEPTTATLSLLALAGLAMRRRRK